MTRYAIRIEFDGTNYNGWQIQKGVPTIQDTLETAIYELTEEYTRVVGSGRTDAGVHAFGQVAHFDIANSNYPSDVYVRGLNNYLPADILVKECAEMSEGFHARYDARQRTYVYDITLEPVAIRRQYQWYVPAKIRRDHLQTAASQVRGLHDFYSFMHARSNTQNTSCDILESEWQMQTHRLRYRITGNRFLHNMVRCLVGTMIEVARGRYSMEEFELFLSQPDKEAPVYRAPAHGLFLEQVRYEYELFSPVNHSRKEAE